MTKEFGSDNRIVGAALRFRTDDRIEYIIVAPDIAALQVVALKLRSKEIEVEKAQRVQITQAA
jgi:hypothetical protein